MRSKLVIAVVAAALSVAALAGCRGRGGEAADRPGKSQPAATTPAGKPLQTLTPQVAASQVSTDLSEVDALLSDLDRQLAEADKTPEDAD